MGQFYLCRHGETAWTISGQHTGRTDIPLTAKGEQQAVQLRARLQRISFDKIFTSPRIRAKQTCEGMGAIIDPHLVEWDYGDYEGLTGQQIRQKHPNWNLFKEGAPHGESPEQVGKRADLVLQTIREFKGNVAIVSHGHFLRVLTARFLQLDPEMAKLFSLSVASLSILGYEKGQPVIILWNDVNH